MNYSIYGYSVFSPCISVLAFNGQVHDRFTNCYLLGNGVRAFSPTFMRFISPDPYSPFGVGGLHTYAYCGGDPVNYMDIDGNTKLRVLTRNDNSFLVPTRQSVIVTPRRASVIVYARSSGTSGVMDTSGQPHDPSRFIAPASPSSSRPPSPSLVTPVAQIGQVQSSWTNPGFEDAHWKEGVSRYVAYKGVHPRKVGQDDPTHIVSALVINKRKGQPGVPFNSYPKYVRAHMKARGNKRVKNASDRLAHFVKAVRDFEKNSGGVEGQ